MHKQKTVKAFGFGIAHEMKSSYSACSLCLKGPSYIGGWGGCKQTRAGVSTLSGDRGWLTRPTEPYGSANLQKRMVSVCLAPTSPRAPFPLFIKKSHNSYMRTNFRLYCTHTVSKHWAGLLSWTSALMLLWLNRLQKGVSIVLQSYANTNNYLSN